MKKLTTLLTIILLSFTALYAANKLNSNAIALKNISKSNFDMTIRASAIREWKSDHSMVVYEINKQSDALVWLTKNFKKKYASEFVGAVINWETDGVVCDNIKVLTENPTISKKTLLMLYCDWTMVKYEYKKQVEAAEAY